MDNVYTLNEIVQGRLREDKKTYAFIVGYGCKGEDVACNQENK